VSVIDTHLHLWQRKPGHYGWLTPELGAIFDDFDADQARAELVASFVDAAVLVQADDSEADSMEMFHAANAHDWIVGVVAWVPLDVPSTAATLLEKWSNEPTFCGVRQLVHDDPRDNFYLLPSVQETVSLLAAQKIPLDVPDAWPRDLGQIVKLAAAHPTLTIVLDHVGKPPADPEELPRWESVFTELGALDNVVVKFSGLHHANRPFSVSGAQKLWDTTTEIFGPHRMMVGSDWPISVAYGGYHPTWSVMENFLAQLGAKDRELVSMGTAQRVYGTSSRLSTMEPQGRA